MAGVKEAHAAGKALKEASYKFDLAHTSVLTRANKTLDAILEEIGQKDIPIQKTWRLNERHYGGLTGLNKAETAQKHGEEQVGAAAWGWGSRLGRLWALRDLLATPHLSTFLWTYCGLAYIYYTKMFCSACR